jgi:phosphoribosylformylglycinamidine cyclo-ligase
MHRYKAAGVDIEAGNRAVEQMKPAIRATYTSNVLADVGSFGGLFALANLPQAPVLVASIDGVGTKVKLAAQLGRWRGIGHDLVNHCINDILVQNARPLFFLDYVAAARLEPDAVAEVVIGIAEACRAAGCVLLGGETAEMPGVYVEGAFDVAGAIVGLVDRAAILPVQAAMQAGDLLIGLPSSGPHTNGYSLIRHALAAEDLAQVLNDGSTLADALLAPHRVYLSEIEQLSEAALLPKGMAHITGGGFVDNVPRVLPDHLTVRLDTQAWTPPPVFQLIVEQAELDRAEAYRVLNMGMGMVLIVGAAQQEAVLAALPQAQVIGVLGEKQAPDPPLILV